MKVLDPGFSVDAGALDKDTWHALLSGFSDWTFYQTWSYGSFFWGERHLDHILLRYGNRPVAMAQLRIARLPGLKAGLAYLPWGPIWRPAGVSPELRYLRNILRALWNKYVLGRGYFLQILPRGALNDIQEIRDLFHEEGFSWSPDAQATVFVDLSGSFDEIRKNMRRTWRQTLQRAAKQPIEIMMGTEERIYAQAEEIIKEMKFRKRFIEYGNMAKEIAVNRDLPEGLKLVFAVCHHHGRPAAVLGWVPGGISGLPIISATANLGLKISASYPLYWKMLEYYKDRGISRCDLGGVSAKRNRGGFIFKTGLAGERSEVRAYIGKFEACTNKISYIWFKAAFFARTRIRQIHQGSREWVRRFKLHNRAGR